jgi:hypothetical protein
MPDPRRAKQALFLKVMVLHRSVKSQYPALSALSRPDPHGIEPARLLCSTPLWPNTGIWTSWRDGTLIFGKIKSAPWPPTPNWARRWRS